MNFLKKNILALIIGLFLLSGRSNAQEIMAVLTDNLKPVSTNYMIYPETSNLIAQDLANLINTNNKIKALPVCNSVNSAKRQSVNNEILKLVKEYQYTYNLNYEILRKISNKLDAPYILLVTSGIDIESDFLKQTVWNMIPIGGENCINPHYKLITQITLIDPNKELILYERSYVKSIPSRDFDLAMPNFSPATGQLNKIKKFSKTLAREISPEIECTLIPELQPEKRTIVDSVFYKYGYSKAPSHNVKQKAESIEQPILDPALDIKVIPNVKLYNYVEGDL